MKLKEFFFFCCLLWSKKPTHWTDADDVNPQTSSIHIKQYSSTSESCWLSPFYLSPLLGRTQILCSGWFCTEWKGNWGFASICTRIGAKIHYPLGLITNIEHVLVWGRWESVEMRLCDTVFPVRHFFVYKSG